MEFMKPVISWVEKGVGGLLAFGKKNKTSIMTGSSIGLGWFGVYMFWRESRKADAIIRSLEERKYEEAKENVKEGDPVPQRRDFKLEKKDAAFIYLECCWPSALLGIGSSFLSIRAHKLDMDEIAKGLLVSQFFKNQSDEKDKEIEKLKAELPDKTVKKVENELHKEKYPEESLCDGYVEETGKGNTLFIEELTGIRFRSSVSEVAKGLCTFKDNLGKMRREQLERRFKDAFFVSENPYPDDMTVYASLGLDEFLKALGSRQKNELGEVLEFRDYGYPDFLSPNLVLDYKNYVDPVTGEPAVCFIHIKEFLSPTFELAERNPL